jgi:ketosteroid isomerase-like protein
MSGAAAALAPCRSGDLYWIELDDGKRSQGFERRCDISGPAGALLRKLSDLAGSRDEEELYQSGVQEILAADRNLAKSARNEGVSSAVTTNSAGDTKIFLSRQPPIVGRSAIAQQYAQWDAKTLLQWEPKGADIAARGDMGYSWGVWTISREGKPEATGNYVNVWRRDGEGDWRLAANIGN